MLCRELSLCIRPSLPWPPVGGLGGPELALGDLEARSTLPSAACSMSQEPYGLLAQQLSQPTTVPKNNFDQVRNDAGVEDAYIVKPYTKIVRRTFRITSRDVRILKLGHWTNFLKTTLGQAPLRQPCFSRLVRGAGTALDGTVCSRRGSLAHGRSRSVGLSVSVDRSFGNFSVLSSQAQLALLRTS